MKKIRLLILLSFPAIGLAVAQENPAFQLKERSGIRLNDKTLELMLNKTWTSYKQYEVTNGQAKLQWGNFFSLKINKDNSFYVSGTRFRQNGTWKANGKKLQLNISDQDETKADFSLEGDYLIYSLSADEMILVREVGDNPALVCYCKSSVVRELDNKPIVSVSKEDKKDIEKEDLVKEIEAELFLRGEKVKLDLEKRNNAELKRIRDMIVKGEFTKEQVLLDEVKTELFLRKLTPPANLEQLSYGKLKKLKKQIISNKYQAN